MDNKHADTDRALSPTDGHEKVVDGSPRASQSDDDDENAHILGVKSLGVKRIEAISAQFTGIDRVLLFIGIFIVAYAYGLDGTIRYTYQVSSHHF